MSIDLSIAEQALKAAQEEYDQAHAAIKTATNMDDAIAFFRIKRFALESLQSRYNDMKQVNTPHLIDSDQEEWRAVMPRKLEEKHRHLFEGVFQVSNKGHVRNTKGTMIPLTPQFHIHHDPSYNLSLKGKQQWAFAYELLMDAFGVSEDQAREIASMLKPKRPKLVLTNPTRNRPREMRNNPASRNHRPAAQIQLIRYLFHVEKWPTSKIAIEFNMDRSTALKIVKGKMYKNVPMLYFGQ